MSNKILFLFIAVFFTVSCQKKIKPMPNDTVYQIDIAYVEDSGLPAFEPKDFFTIFNDKLPKLTFKILGYKVRYNLKVGMTEEDFYNVNRDIIRKDVKRFEDEYIDIKRIEKDDLISYIYGSISKENDSVIKKLFGYPYNTPAINIAKNIAPSFRESILTVWNSPAKNRSRLLQPNRYLMYTAEYWRIIASKYKEASLIIINMPISSNYKGMSAKSIANGGFVDRLTLYNSKSKPSRAVSVVSTYPLLASDGFFSSIREKSDYNTSVNIFTYYVLQTVSMMMNRYDIHDDEPHSIMAEVSGFDYISWYENISKYPLREPYRVLRSYPDSIK